ncbi:MAG: SDR family oxidoreductase [Lachnospiraceae bacterium]|nr:SDR family oxidoreductase [Lachnospiraceae bacterium]
MINIDLKGKTVLVTGGTGQLGRVISETFAKAGADVIVHYNSNEEKAKELEVKLKEYGVETFIVKADVTKKESIDEMKALIEKEFHMPDIIVDNAVIQYIWKPVIEQDVPDYYSQFESCVMQTVYMTKAFVPHMIENKWGRVLVTNTECAAMAEVGQSAYVAGKRGLDGIIRCLAKEVGEHGITVNQVAPGWTISENDRINGTEAQEYYDKTVPLKHRGEDQDIANMFVFLASDMAKFTTGAYIPVSGGRVMPGI